MANILGNYESLLKKTRNGDLHARENLILLVYEKVKVYAKKCNIPEKYREDAISEAMTLIIDRIDNGTFKANQAYFNIREYIFKGFIIYLNRFLIINKAQYANFKVRNKEYNKIGTLLTFGEETPSFSDLEKDQNLDETENWETLLGFKLSISDCYLDDVVISRDTLKLIKQELEKMNWQDKYIFLSFGKSLDELAKELGVSKQRINERYQKVLRTLQDTYIKNEEAYTRGQ